MESFWAPFFSPGPILFFSFFLFSPSLGLPTPAQPSRCARPTRPNASSRTSPPTAQCAPIQDQSRTALDMRACPEPTRAATREPHPPQPPFHPFSPLGSFFFKPNRAHHWGHNELDAQRGGAIPLATKAVTSFAALHCPSSTKRRRVSRTRTLPQCRRTTAASPLRRTSLSHHFQPFSKPR